MAQEFERGVELSGLVALTGADGGVNKVRIELGELSGFAGYEVAK